MATVLDEKTEMQAATEQPSLPTLRLFTVAEYYKMAAAGILAPDERVELLEGRIVKLNPKGIRHAAVNDHAGNCFRRWLGDRVLVRIQNPIHLGDASEPEPDLVLAAPQEKEYFDHHPTPTEVLLAVEIADSSLRIDRGLKSRLYAQAGIIQYCIINLSAREVEDYREPGADGYRSKQTYSAGQSLNLVAFPEVAISVDELLPSV
jgi:Uma2 family endonuclease